MTIELLQPLAELVTLKVEVVDVQQTQMRGYIGGRHVTIVMQGQVLIGTDLSQARLEEVKEGSAVIVLPSPRVISAWLDHERTRIVGSEASGVWMIVPGDAGRTVAADRAYEAAQKRLAEAAADEKLIARARRQAEVVWTELGVRVEVRWGE